MNNIISSLFLLFFSVLNVYCQDQEATLYFKDGETFVGYGDIVQNKKSVNREDKIVFRLSKEDEPSYWDSEDVDKITFHFFETSRTFRFVNRSFNGKITTELHEVISEGEVNLYVDNSSDWVRDAPLPGFQDMGMRKVEKKSFYVKRETEDKFTTLGGSKKKIAEYFKGCPGIVKKLESNEFNIGTLEDIVNYYNDYCAGYQFDEDGENEEIDSQKKE